MSEYYDRLGVPRDADGEQIKKAYRKVALKYHPDRNKGSKDAEARFKEATEAYEVLRDPEKRARYDRYGPDGLRGGRGGFQGGFDFSDALNIFMRDFGGFGGLEDLFGGGRRPQEPARGKALRVTIPLTLAEVRTGATKAVNVAVLDTCQQCRGTGARGGARPTPCAECGGAGQVRRAERSVFGQFVSVVPCGRCRGEGAVVADRCGSCHGDGRTRTTRKVRVRVPPGVSSENYITLRGEGNVGPRGGARGDIMALLDVKEDPRFVRDGNDLITEVPVTFAQAALGAQVTVPTVEGEEEVKVQPGTQSGAVVRVRGEGLPDVNGRGQGDLLVRLVVWVPQRLTPEQERLIQELRALEDPPPATVDADGRRGFWDRVKDALG